MSDLLVRLKLDDRGLDAQLKGVSSKFKQAAAGIAAIAVPIAAIAGIARMVEGLAAIGERAIEAAGSLHDTAAQLGVTAERLQELRLIAKNAGVEVEGFDKALSVLNRTLGQASLGQGNFEKIALSAGIALRNEQGQIKSTAEVWDMLTAKIQSGAITQNQAIGLAAAAFGREGGKMVQVLRQTAEEQQKVIDTARKFGAILSNEVVRSADAYGDQLELIKKGTEALGIQNDLILAPLTLAWAKLKNEISFTTAALLRASGLIDDNLILQQRRLENLERTMATMRLALTSAGLDDEAVNAHPSMEVLLDDWRELNTLIAVTKQTARDQAGSLSPTGPDEGELILSDEAAKAAEKAAEEKARIDKAAADYELQLVTDVYAERERLRALEMEQEFGWATTMAEERERFYAEELEQEFQWATVLAEERDRAANMELFQFKEKEGLLTQARREGVEARAAFDKMAAGQQVATTIGALTEITAAVAQHSKKAFELNKLAAIANAIVNTAQGATKALAQGGFAGIAMAAAVIAAGAVQIGAIRKTTFQGGGAGTTPSAVATRPVINDQPVGAGKSSTIRLEGLDPSKLYSGRELLERLNEAISDGGKLVIVGA